MAKILTDRNRRTWEAMIETMSRGGVPNLSSAQRQESVASVHELVLFQDVADRQIGKALEAIQQVRQKCDVAIALNQPVHLDVNDRGALALAEALLIALQSGVILESQ